MRLLSYNIHKGVGGRDQRYRLDRTIDVIESQNPDVVCLQEVTYDAPRCRHDDQPQLLTEYFKAEGTLFQKNVHYRRGGYGNMIFTRWPIVEAHRLSLRMNSKKPRGAQVVVVDTPEGQLNLVNWHLGLAEKERHWQVNHLLKHQTFRQLSDLPTLIVGDFNDWRNTLEGQGLADEGFTHVTHPISRFRSFPAWLPMGALDKAFFRGAVEVRHAKLVRSQQSRRASDHLPLVLDFHLNGNGPE